MFQAYFVSPIITIVIWWSFEGFGNSNYALGALASICPGNNAWYYDGGTLQETTDICKPFTKHCFVGRNQGRYWQNYTNGGVLDLEIVSTTSSILHLNTTILSQYTLTAEDVLKSTPSDKLYLSLLKYWSQERKWNQTLAHVRFDLTNVLHKLQFCVKQFPSNTQTTLCDFKGTIPTHAYHFGQVREITFTMKFDLNTKSVYVFVYLGNLDLLSSFSLQIDTESVTHYKGNYAFKIDRSVVPKQHIQFNSIFHTEGGSSYEDLENILTFQKLFPEMFCPIKKESFCELSETCINASIPCKDKSGGTLILKNIQTGRDIINFDNIAVNTVEKITIVLSGKSGLLYPIIGHSGNFIDVLNISTELGKEHTASHHVIGTLNNGPEVSFNATLKCSVFSVIILLSSQPNEWCFSGNQPTIYIAKDKQVVLLGHLISNPRFWRSINVSGIKDIIRVKIEKRPSNRLHEEYPMHCSKGDYISLTNIGMVAIGIVFVMAITGVLSNYFHRY